MRVAFPTNDKASIFKRSGRADGFLIVDILEKDFEVVDFRVNLHKHDHDNPEHDHHNHSHKEIIDALNDCECLVVNVVGKHFGKDLQNAGIKIFKTDKITIREAVTAFRNNK